MKSYLLAFICTLLFLQACTEVLNTIDSSSLESSSVLTDSRVVQRPNNIPSAEIQINTLSVREHCEAVIASVRDAGFEDRAWVQCTSGHAYIHSDSFPDHEVMAGVTGSIEQLPWPAPGYYASVRFNPAFSGIPANRDSSMAVAVNGIPIFDYSVGGELEVEELFHHQPHLDAMIRGEIDECGGHAGRGDDYHYHELPRCMIEEMDNKDDNPIIGWGFDGFPLYGNNNPDGSPIAPGTLDVCNGQLDPVFGYRYHTSDEYPYIVQCLAGEVDLESAPSISMANVEGDLRPVSMPIKVENHIYTVESSGLARLTYDYEGESYFISVEPTDDPACYDQRWKVVAHDKRNDGIAEGSGVYCHMIRSRDSQSNNQ